MTDKSADKKKLVINSAEDLLAALDSGNASVVVAVLRAIALDPQKALSYGNGCDLATILKKRFLAARGNVFKTGYLAAMVAIDAPDYLDAYKIGFFMHDCPEVMLASASKLAERPEGEVRDFLTTALFNDAMPKQAQLAANIMSRFAELGTREAIRVALLANREDVALPALSGETLPAWIAELCGSLREDAMRLLEDDAGETGFRFLKARWLDLPLHVRAWVLEWGARSHPVPVLDLLADGLNTGTRELMLAALSGLASLPEFAKHLNDRITRLVHSDDRDMRIAALKAMPETTEAMVRDSAHDTESLLIALRKLPPRQDHQQLLFELLGNERWEVRSAATQKLMALAPAAADHALGIYNSDLAPGTQVALSRILMGADNEDPAASSA
jgi:hypothetical protein